MYELLLRMRILNYLLLALYVFLQAFLYLCYFCQCNNHCFAIDFWDHTIRNCCSDGDTGKNLVERLIHKLNLEKSTVFSICLEIITYLPYHSWGICAATTKLGKQIGKEYSLIYFLACDILLYGIIWYSWLYLFYIFSYLIADDSWRSNWIRCLRWTYWGMLSFS